MVHLLLVAVPARRIWEDCRTQNNQLTADYQNAKETIAANNARIKSLEDQLAQARESAAGFTG